MRQWPRWGKRRARRPASLRFRVLQFDELEKRELLHASSSVWEVEDEWRAEQSEAGDRYEAESVVTTSWYASSRYAAFSESDDAEAEAEDDAWSVATPVAAAGGNPADAVFSGFGSSQQEVPSASRVPISESVPQPTLSQHSNVASSPVTDVVSNTVTAQKLSITEVADDEGRETALTIVPQRVEGDSQVVVTPARSSPGRLQDASAAVAGATAAESPTAVADSRPGESVAGPASDPGPTRAATETASTGGDRTEPGNTASFRDSRAGAAAVGPRGGGQSQSVTPHWGSTLDATESVASGGLRGGRLGPDSSAMAAQGPRPPLRQEGGAAAIQSGAHDRRLAAPASPSRNEDSGQLWDVRSPSLAGLERALQALLARRGEPARRLTEWLMRPGVLRWTLAGSMALIAAEIVRRETRRARALAYLAADDGTARWAWLFPELFGPPPDARS